MSIFKSQINADVKNIWRYSSFYPPIEEKFRLTDGEGNTPEIELREMAKYAGLPSIIFKREDQNPGGSHKDRGLAYQISRTCEEGRKSLIISSSGNAAISAGRYCNLAGIKLFVFVSEKIEKAKLARILEYHPAAVFASPKPVTFAEYASKKFNIKNIKSSADENSIYGYKSIGFEIFEHLGDVDSIFLAVSSGSTFLGIAESYRDLIRLGEVKKMPQLHIVQTSKVHPLSMRFDNDFKFEKENLAKAIVSRKVIKEKEIINMVIESKGSGWVVQNDEIIKASQILEKNNISTSYEGAAALAGIIKARRKGFDIGKKAVCLLTGKKYEEYSGEIIKDSIYKKIDTLLELENLMQKFL